MSYNKKEVSINHQDHPRQEGQALNTTPINRGDGQRNSNNNNQPMNNMMNESEEQKAGRPDDQKTEEEVRQDMRTP